ncbi:hypothetical protein [[Actinomadura] parvosata]|uniref:hypothetical protein n=1 Tax=[Actinomadura] parvosata TaxID=1955412 RepID=UPI0012BCA9B8|nr:hypothetical protein [Nonomuraea sp. ATCC 55076]
MVLSRRLKTAGLFPLLLAVLLAFGLAAMHTLGHQAPVADRAGVLQVDSTHPAMPASHHGGTSHEDRDAAIVCLAILAGLIALAVPLLSLVSMFEALSGSCAQAGRRAARMRRGPPSALVLMRTVVLRT